MPVDFGALVLKPCEDIFSVSILVTPYASNPDNLTPYLARGIYRSKVEVISTGAGMHSTTQPVLGIRLAEYAIPPKQYDQIEILANQPSIDALGSRFFTIADTKPDGQGGVEWILSDNLDSR